MYKYRFFYFYGVWENAGVKKSKMRKRILESCGVSHVSLHNWEHVRPEEEFELQILVLKKVCEIFQCTQADFIQSGVAYEEVKVVKPLIKQTSLDLV